MLVLTVEEIKEFEEYTMNKLGLSHKELMSKAGTALANDFLQRAHPKKGSLIGVIAGVGNNGGDALVVAIVLQNLGYKPAIYVIGEISKASDAFLHYFELAGKVTSISNQEELDIVQFDIMKADYIIDGLFGIGLSKMVEGFRSELMNFINTSESIVYSIDIPSGIDPNNGLCQGNAIRANYTGVVGYLKIGNLYSDALDYHGEIEVLNIGIIQKFAIKRELIEQSVSSIKKPLEKHNSNKYSNGLGVFVGGRKSMMGSIQMSAISAMKCGLGITIVLSDLREDNYTQFYPEVIIQNHVGEEVNHLLDRAKVVVFGPGIGVNNQDYQNILDYVLNTNIPLLIDASGFQYLDISNTYRNEHVVLTPHIGELAKMFGKDSKEVLREPFTYINRLTEKGFHVVLKGPCTIVASIGKSAFIQAKNPGLATAGTGDVLSGIIAAFLSREQELDAMVSGVMTHALAGDAAKQKFGEISMLATDVLESIYQVLK